MDEDLHGTVQRMVQALNIAKVTDAQQEALEAEIEQDLATSKLLTRGLNLLQLWRVLQKDDQYQRLVQRTAIFAAKSIGKPRVQSLET